MNRVQDQQPKVMALRLYFPTRSRAAATRFWHRLSAPALAQHLLAAAKRAHVQQALLYQVASGFLKGERVTHHHIDVSDMRHPQCLELIDTEMQLRAFMHEHAHELHKVRAVLFLCEESLTDHAGFAAHRFPTQGDIA